MGCGASNDISRVQEPTLNKKPVLPAIESQRKKKSPSAKSNGSTDSGIEDSEPIKGRTILIDRHKELIFCILVKPPPAKVVLTAENFYVEHHQKSRLGHGETFEIITGPKPNSLAPLRNVPKFLAAQKPVPTVDPDLQAKLAAKQERASRKRRVGHLNVSERLI